MVKELEGLLKPAPMAKEEIGVPLSLILPRGAPSALDALRIACILTH
jgi:hypothetical protein